tara:strand:- start:1304 stop:1534 length:231 start_codon:yes stop_codon:yes gene_type:complete
VSDSFYILTATHDDQAGQNKTTFSTEVALQWCNERDSEGYELFIQRYKRKRWKMISLEILRNPELEKEENNERPKR